MKLTALTLAAVIAAAGTMIYNNKTASVRGDETYLEYPKNYGNNLFNAQ